MKEEFAWIAAAIALAAGVAAGLAMPSLAPLWPAAALLSVLAFFFSFGRGSTRTITLCVFFLGVAAAMRRAEERIDSLDRILELNRGRPVEGRFTIPNELSCRTDGESGKKTVSFPGTMDGIRVRVHFTLAEGEPPPVPGETWHCAGWMNRDGGLFGAARRSLWVRGRGTFARRDESPGCDRLRSAAIRIRDSLSRRLGVGLENSPETAGLLRALLLGDRSALTRSARDTFAAAGTIHVFAISGLHVVIVSKLLSLLLTMLFIPRRWTGLALIPLTWGYVWITGAGPSAVRAAAMASFYFAAPMFWRKPNALMSWLITFICAHVVHPEALLDAGSLLSFTVMLSLILWARTGFAVGNGLASGVVASSVAWAAGAPIVARYFGLCSPGGLIVNIVMIPAAGVAVTAGALGVFASFMSETAASYLNGCAGMSIEVMQGLSVLVASIPLSAARPADWSIPFCATWYVALAAGLALLRLAPPCRRRTKSNIQPKSQHLTPEL